MVDTRTSQVRGIGPRRNPPIPRPRQVTQPTVPGEQPPPPVVLTAILPPIPPPIDPVIPSGLPPTIVPFARTPALAERSILDYTSRQGYRIYGQPLSSLSISNTMEVLICYSRFRTNGGKSQKLWMGQWHHDDSKPNHRWE